MSHKKMPSDTYLYRLPLDKQVDKDIIDWLNTLPSKKKAEVVRYALRFYMSQLTEDEIFKIPSGHSAKRAVSQEKPKRRPKVGLLQNLAKK